jgi:hypothetical protein
MIKYWCAATTKEGKPVKLYVETYDAAIDHDVEQAPSCSLIYWASGHSIPTDEEQRHHALALGAFRRHTMAEGYTPVGEIYETDSIPKGLEDSWVGGTVKEPAVCAVIVYEQPIA